VEYHHIRYQWLLSKAKQRHIDVLDADFVNEYITEFKPPHKVTIWGANKCKQLSLDMTRMAKLGYLKRRTCSLAGNWQPGFPKWVWSYSPGKYAHLLENEDSHNE